MKKILLLIALIPFIGTSQDYEIANWYNYKKGAVCLTFDDGTLDQQTNAIPALNAKGIPATFFLNMSSDYSWAVRAIANGHEIANHTKSHSHLSKIGTNLFATEISDFQMLLANKTGANVTTLAYPYGEGGEVSSDVFYIQDSVAKTHIGARSVTQPINDNAYRYDFYQDDRAYYQVNTIHMKNSMVGYDSTFRKVIQYGGLMTYMFHAVGNKNGWDNIDRDKFESFLDTLKRYDAELWMATFQDVIKYHRERKSATLVTVSEPFENGDTWVLSLTDGLNDSIYDHKLTVKVAIPSSVTGVISISQNNVMLPFKVLNDSVLFNALPDGGNIQLEVVNCEQPLDSISVTGELVLCTPDSVVIEAVYNKDYTYSWFNGSVPFGKDTNKIVIQENGVFSGLIQLKGCPIYTDSVAVEITGRCGVPNADFTASAVREFLGEEIMFTSTSSNLEGGELYYWNFGEGASLEPGFYGADAVKVSYATPGEKTVVLVATGSEGADTLTKMRYIEVSSVDVCGLYKEDFKNNYDLKFFDCWCNYEVSIVNDAFRITTNDSTANEWFSVTWDINELIQDGMRKKIIDFSDPLFKPVLKVRVKASDTALVAFSLGDMSKTATAGMGLNQISYFDATTEYQVFEVDFSDLFFYEWDNPTSPVDSTKIAYIQMTINEGFKSYPITNSFGQRINKQFVGNVDIDWISIGERCQPDSLIANIVKPNEVCAGETFNVWNHSSPKLDNAELEWSFDTIFTSYDINTSDELPIEIIYEDFGFKEISLTVTTNNDETVTVVERVNVKDCTVGLDELEGQVSTNFVNPVSSSVKGTINSLVDQDAFVVLTDMKGRILLHDQLKLAIGSNRVNYKNLDLKNGMYLLTIYTTTHQYQVKLTSTGN